MSNNQVTSIKIRKANQSDREAVIRVESLSTLNLSYLPNVFEMFVSDHVGEFCVAEMDNQIVACGKFSVMPDGSAWVETLRVIPAFQGLGVGKRIYERFFEVAKSRQITTLRMYTGVRNAVSKGLAERYGFKLAATYRGAWNRCGPESIRESILPFQQITDLGQAVDLLMPLHQKWHGHFVMNRTFYAITPALCRDWTQKGLVYTEPSTGSVLIAGARFMPEQALHIGVLQGDIQACLNFAMQKGIEVGAEKLSCLFPPSAKDIQESLLGYGFELEKSDFIVMANESGRYDRKD